MPSTIKLEKTCLECGSRFVARTTVTHCCSERCAKRNYKKRIREEKVQKAIALENVRRPFNPVVVQKDFLSVNETCQLLGTSRWTVYRLIDKGVLDATKLGDRVVISRKAVNKLFNK